jgi:hypothetical protein
MLIRECNSWYKPVSGVTRWRKSAKSERVSIERLGQKIGRVTAEELSLIVEGLNEIIGA